MHDIDSIITVTSSDPTGFIRTLNPISNLHCSANPNILNNTISYSNAPQPLEFRNFNKEKNSNLPPLDMVISPSDSFLNESMPSLPESILNDSRITPTGNGSFDSKSYYSQPTSGQKLWASVLLGFLFALISSPTAYNITSKATNNIGFSLMDGLGPNLIGLFIHTIIFIIIVRIILW